MKSLRERNWLVGWVGLFALLMTALAVIGGVKNYSPIPFWDMWSGVYGFILGIQDGKYDLWWSQHNEHRIVLARLFFWIDYAFFGFKAAFLIVCNYLFLVIAGWIFACFIKKVSHGTEKRGSAATVLTLFVFGWLFLWTQKENLTWAFQSQFFLAQLLPLAMFYFLATAADKESDGHYVMACLLGVLSAGTMANGVVALPLAFLMSCFLPFSRSKRTGLLLLAIAVPLFYFSGYSQPPGHGSLTKTLMSDPLGVLRYTMAYIGGPFHAMTKFSSNALVVAEVAGGILILASVWAAAAWLLARNKSPYVGALLFFILFIGGTAVGTAGGRLIFGLGQATSERYTTPAVMAWAALLVVGFSYVTSFTTRGRKMGSVMLFLASVVLLAYQSQAARLNDVVAFEHKVGALAATLGVGDRVFVKQLYPAVDYVMSLVPEVEKRQLGFTDVFPFKGNVKAIGSEISVGAVRSCPAAFDQLDALPMGNGYLRLVGWALDAQNQTVPEKLTVLDAKNQVIGFVITGGSRKDLTSAFGDYAKHGGFVGYVKSAAQGQPVRLIAAESSCVMQGVLPKLVYEVFDDVSKNPPTVNADALLSNVNYTGRSNVLADSAPGSTIFSSYVNGDADVGAIKLRLRNGDVLMYKTGPIANRQLLKSEVATVSLPQSDGWSTLRFVGFPDETLHEITIEDAGNSWGEWSAIALRNQ